MDCRSLDIKSMISVKRARVNNNFPQNIRPCCQEGQRVWSEESRAEFYDNLYSLVSVSPPSPPVTVKMPPLPHTDNNDLDEERKKELIMEKKLRACRVNIISRVSVDIK